MAIKLRLLQVSERRAGGSGDHNPKLLVQLSDKSYGQGLMLLDVAARKVPDTWIPTATGRTVAEEHLVGVDEKTSCDAMDASGPALSH